MSIEERTARLTILIDPRKKKVFERLCAEEDLTPSQVVRRLIRSYIEERQGRPWRPEDARSLSSGGRRKAGAVAKKKGARKTGARKTGG